MRHLTYQSQSVSDEIAGLPRSNYDLFSASPESVYSRTRNLPIFAELLERLRVERPRMLGLGEEALRKKMEAASSPPTVILERLRHAFWADYDLSVDNQREMSISHITRGLCTEDHLKHLLSDDMNLCFLLVPPTHYKLQTEEALARGIENVRKIVNLDIMNKDGTVNTKVADLVLKAVAFLDLRVHGAAVQRIDTRSLNMNVNTQRVPESREELEQALLEHKQEYLTSRQHKARMGIGTKIAKKVGDVVE